MVSFTGEDQYQELSQGNKQPAARVIHKKVNDTPVSHPEEDVARCCLETQKPYNVEILTSLKCFTQGFNLEKCDPNKSQSEAILKALIVPVNILKLD